MRDSKTMTKITWRTPGCVVLQIQEMVYAWFVFLMLAIKSIRPVSLSASERTWTHTIRLRRALLSLASGKNFSVMVYPSEVTFFSM